MARYRLFLGASATGSNQGGGDPAPLPLLGLILGVSSNVDVMPSTGVMSFVGNVASIILTATITATTGTVSFIGNQPTVASGSAATGAGNIAPLPALGTLFDPYTKTPTTGVISFTGNQATILGFPQDKQPTTGVISFTGNLAIVDNSSGVQPTTGVITFSGNQPQVASGSIPQVVIHDIPNYWFADVGHLARWAYLPVGINQWNRESVQALDIQPTTGVITFTGNVPVAGTDVLVVPNTGNIEFTGNIGTIGLTNVVVPATGLVTFTGNQPFINTQSLSSPTTGVITFTGYAATLNLAVDVSPATGVVSFLSQTPSIDTQETKVQPTTGVITFIGYRPDYTGAVNSLDLIAERPAGGWLRKPRKEWYEKLPTPEEIEAERTALGILPKKAQKIIKETVSAATDSVDEKQAALLAAAYLEETQQRNLVDRLRTKADKAKAKWTDDMFTVTRALILDELRKKADAAELERLLMQQEHEEVEANEILELWMEEL